MKLIETLLEIWEYVKDDPVIVSALIVAFCGIITITITMISIVLRWVCVDNWYVIWYDDYGVWIYA